MNYEIVVFQVLLLKGSWVQVLVGVVMAACKTQLKKKKLKILNLILPEKFRPVVL